MGYSVSQAIESGVITTTARRRIISVLRGIIVQYSLYPTSEQYNAVCRALISKYPKLKDTCTLGSEFVRENEMSCACHK